jgi:3,4-dihydroxy 2-butanone 4-phosphate synthase / GTP cyclohydrolase II
VTSVPLAAEPFACDQPVLVGAADELPVFVAAAAEGMDADRLERLERLSRGLIVLGVEDAIATRLRLPTPAAWPGSRLDLPFTASIDAARGARAAWSRTGRSLTMRVAADPRTIPCDLAIPGHVHLARVSSDDLLTGGGTASAALELARVSGKRGVVALGAVVDSSGRFVSLTAARRERRFSRLPLTRLEDLRAIKRADRAARVDVDCALPTRAGPFRVLAHLEGGGETTLALVHGDLAGTRAPLVHIHRACLLGDAFGSLACPCRVALERAIADIAAEGAGVLVYVKPGFASFECERERALDPSVIAGVLRAAGVPALRLGDKRPATATALRALGLIVESRAAAPTAPQHRLRTVA